MKFRKFYDLLMHHLRHIGLPLAILIVVITISQAGHAQVLYGSIVGNVKDANGATVAGASVVITHKETGQTREGVTDSTGGYDFQTVQAGTYIIKVVKSGFKTLTRENIAVTLNNVTRADVTIEVGQVSETVVISAESAQLKTDRAEVSSEITRRPLRD